MAMVMRLAPFFPARVLPGDGIEIIRTGGMMTVAMNWDNIQQASLPVDPENYEFTLRNEDGSFIRVPVEQIILPQVTWDTLSGKPSTFPPSAHTHDISGVNGLQLALDAKVNTSDTIAADRGGTGQTSFTVGDLLYASGTSALSKLAAGTSSYVLTSNGAGVAPTWQAQAATPVGSVVKSAMTRHTTFTSGTAAMVAGNDTIPQITDGFSIFNAAAFTPTSATNLLRVTVLGQVVASAAANYWGALFRDAVAGAKAAQALGSASTDTPASLGLVFEEVAGSTAATTFRLRLGNNNGGTATLAVNGVSGGRRLGGSSGVTILIEEIKV